MALLLRWARGKVDRKAGALARFCRLGQKRGKLWLAFAARALRVRGKRLVAVAGVFDSKRRGELGGWALRLPRYPRAKPWRLLLAHWLARCLASLAAFPVALFPQSRQGRR